MSEEKKEKRTVAMQFDKFEFAKLIINDLSQTQSGQAFLKKYTQSEVREIIENYKDKRNQEKLREITRLLWAKSPHYQRLIKHFAYMALFYHVLVPTRDISKVSKNKLMKQYVEIAELLKLMNLKHEMKKVVEVAFCEDIFYGYVHRDKNSFYIQPIDPIICKISSVEDGIFNFSIDMTYFEANEDRLELYADEIKEKYRRWKRLKNELKKNKGKTNLKDFQWVELDPKNTICIKVNEHILDIFPPFAGIFDAIFDIEAFKRLRKDKEELGNYMALVQKLPIREDSEENNDFLIDKDMMMFFHNMIAKTVPENVGVITSPMPIEPIKFDKDKPNNDGVAQAERDFWSGSGTSQLLFNADKSTSEGLKASIKTDEEIVFGVLTQIERWINRYLKLLYKDLYFNVNILHITYFNRQDIYKMYMEAGQYGIPVKSYIAASLGMSPIEVLSMAYFENEILKLHETFIPLQSSHTMSDKNNPLDKGGAPKKEDISDETLRHRDKPNTETQT